MTLQYHPGQIQVQEEANTRPVADMLADWVGPVGEFSGLADLLVFATPDAAGDLRFAVVSGTAPLIEPAGRDRIHIPGLTLPLEAPSPALAGGIAINLAQRRRARINGTLSQEGDGWTLSAAEAFTNCRKYMAPSLALDGARHAGPTKLEPLALDDPSLRELLTRAETAFLASISPEGLPDVSHRGGPPGFVELDAAAGVITWPEFVGDGMFKTAGNIRATGNATLLVFDLDSGDAVELSGSATFQTLRTNKQARTDALLHGKDPFPIQGKVSLTIRGAHRLPNLISPRRRLEKTAKITSCSAIEEQYPQ